MNIIGIGTDLVEIPRIEKILEKHPDRFLQKTYTPKEIAYCQSHQNPLPHFAARFAAKEAAAKALGTGIGAAAAFAEIEVIRAKNGQPSLQLHGNAAQTAAKKSVSSSHLTLTHTENYAVAFVIFCCKNP